MSSRSNTHSASCSDALTFYSFFLFTLSSSSASSSSDLYHFVLAFLSFISYWLRHHLWLSCLWLLRLPSKFIAFFASYTKIVSNCNWWHPETRLRWLLPASLVTSEKIWCRWCRDHASETPSMEATSSSRWHFGWIYSTWCLEEILPWRTRRTWQRRMPRLDHPSGKLGHSRTSSLMQENGLHSIHCQNPSRVWAGHECSKWTTGNSNWHSQLHPWHGKLLHENTCMETRYDSRFLHFFCLNFLSFDC